MTLHIGTSGWSYDHWQGVLYPYGIPLRERLSTTCSSSKRSRSTAPSTAGHQITFSRAGTAAYPTTSASRSKHLVA